MRKTLSALFSPNGRPRLPPPPYLGATNQAKDKYSKPTRLLQNPDAIVIGSGIGGLGIASILAQRKGARVLLLEANSVPGGCTHCHELGGFEWNSGIDSIGDMDPGRGGRGMFRPTIDFITGGQLEWVRMPDVHEVAIFGEDRYEWRSDPAENIEWLSKMFPQASDGIKRYYDLESTIEWWAWSWGLTKLLPEWMPESARQKVYELTGGAWRQYMLRPTNDVFRDELGFPDKLRAIFSYMYGNHGRTPAHSPFAFHAVNLQHYRHGAYYPVGGPGQIAECVIPIVEHAGGQLAVSTPAKRILVENDTAVGVELDDGEKVYSPLVISDAGAYASFMELLDRDVAERHGYPARFEEIRPSVAHLYLFLGYEEALELPKEIVWYLPSYDIEHDDAGFKDRMDLDCMGCYILSPSARDPVYGQRYPGKSTVIVLGEAPYKWVERCKADKKFKKEFEKKIGTHLEGIVTRLWPRLEGKKPAYRRAGVPMGCNLFAWEGCSLGVEPSADRFLRHTHWLRPKTRIKNYYLTGQDAFSPGFAGSMVGSKLCYAAITDNWALALSKRIRRFP